MFTAGILATLRSKKLDGKIIGVMVTASHNPEEVSRPDPMSSAIPCLTLLAARTTVSSSSILVVIC
jgi:phosphoacetylglucosamine mutase